MKGGIRGMTLTGHNNSKRSKWLNKPSENELKYEVIWLDMPRRNKDVKEVY